MHHRNIKILLIEDDIIFCDQVKQILGVYNEVTSSHSLSEARSHLDRTSFDLMIIDKHLPDGVGYDFILEVKKSHADLVIIVLSGSDDFNGIQKCIAAGAQDYLVKSENIISELLVRIPIAISRTFDHQQGAKSQLALMTQQAFRYEIVGKAASTNELRHTIQSYKGCHSSVLITGESGTGKELVARRLHAIEENKTRPFIAINCSAIPGELVESELFGHVRGSFTGAIEDKMGKFELANGGDLFLDEVAELPLTTQAKLLRVIQDGEITRVGSSKVISLNVRVIAATNAPLADRVKKGLFREDLFYRLNVIRIRLEPLRKRREDISDLARFFIVQLSGAKSTLSAAALETLAVYDWPGNIRQLKNCMERAVLSVKRRNSKIIEPEDINIDPEEASLMEGPDSETSFKPPKDTNELTMDHYQKFLFNSERHYFKTALELCLGNADETALKLGLGRSTVFKKIKEFGLTRTSGSVIRG